jgi:hypothetical protein
MIVPPQPSPGIDFADSASVLGTRIRSILAEPRRVPWWRNLYAVAAGVLCLLVFVRCAPALSFEFDLTNERSAAQPATAPVIGVHPGFNKPGLRHHEAVRHTKVSAVAPDSTYSYPDNLTTLPLRETRSVDTGMSTSIDPQPTMFTSDEDSAPLWAESPSRAGRSKIGTVRDVVLATAGGIALGERGERGEHGTHGHKLSH